MDSQFYGNRRSNGFATAALVLGIVGLATGCCVYTSIICGALAIIFALLSRNGKMDVRAQVGLGLGIAGIVIGILLVVAAFATVITEYGSFWNYYETIVQTYYDMLGIDPSAYPYY